MNDNNKLALEILDELLLEEKLIGNFLRAEDAYHESANELKKHFMPKAEELLAEAIAKPEECDEILKMVARIVKSIPDSITNAYIFECIREKNLMDRYKEVNGIKK